jgi:4'-phosphopantetheinyl transferase
LEKTTFNNHQPDVWNLENEIQVWRFPAIPLASPLLTATEKESAARFRFEGDRNRYVMGRHAQRLLLSEYLSVDPFDLPIFSETGQKPFVSRPSSKIYFNTSHSGEWVVLAFARDELGIDIEKADPVFAYDDILKVHFSEAEKAYVLSAADSTAAFFFLWTRKEALTKAWGTGLQENLKEVSVLDDDPLIGMNHLSWSLRSFAVSENYPAALASHVINNIVFLDGLALLPVK